jgi:predicted dehydrogenase
MGYDLALSPSHFVYSHARALSSHPEFRLVGAVEVGFSQREAFKRAYKVPAYGSLEQALAFQTVDLAILATPTQTHHRLLCELLNLTSLKAILCEKPLSYNLDESREMLKLCAKKNVDLYVNYMRHSEPGSIEVKRRIDSGEIAGPLKGVIWYSKGFLHNGSHFFNLLEYWLGGMQGFKLLNAGRSLLCGDAEPDVHVTFQKGEAVFLGAKDENFSHNTIELVAKNGRLRYENGGRYIEWTAVDRDKDLKDYTFLTRVSEEIPSELNRCQYFVVEQLSVALKGNTARLCSGAQALGSLEAMYSILESRG